MMPITIRWKELPAREEGPPFGSESHEDLFSWEIPRRGESLWAMGAVAEIQSAGTDRFERAAALRELARKEISIEGDTPVRAPLWVGGFSFSDEPGAAGEDWLGFPALRFAVPRRLFLRRKGRSFEAEATGGDPRLGFAGPDSESQSAAPRGVSGSAVAASSLSFGGSNGAADRSLFSQACASTRCGELQKIVVARAASVASDEGFPIERILAALRRAHPDCRHYRVRRGNAVFLGATPERLLCVAGERVSADAIAGTTRRGESPEEEARLRRTLFLSKKEQEEHALVVEGLRTALARHDRDVVVPEAPRVIATGGVQHLHTPLEATIPGGELLRLAGELHPSPAVAGSPVSEARAWIASHERFERGWYAGGVGWLDGTSGGEIAVALRCGLFRANRGRLYAGAGIVAASDPEKELAETRLKMHSLLDAMQAC
ncbi:MAG: isochorismate synthase [bacterium]|nr:isochorismate synthase [bacterium]